VKVVVSVEWYFKVEEVTEVCTTVTAHRDPATGIMRTCRHVDRQWHQLKICPNSKANPNQT